MAAGVKQRLPLSVVIHLSVNLNPTIFRWERAAAAVGDEHRGRTYQQPVFQEGH
jgi:hypothetical protein